jgi:cellulose synthase/poly-beta-1,6-N-acetylglucosamine synthase-like glycosyltransferase
MALLFWLSFGILFYAYLGYGLVMWILVKIRGAHPVPLPYAPEDLPEVTVLIAAYNEADIIQQKIENTLALDYPKDKLKLLFITDGSTDNTGAIIEQYPDIQHLFEPERRGKIAAVQRAMPLVTSPITINSDANTFLNAAAARNLVKHFADPTIGAVAGEKLVWSDTKDTASAAGEGLYWQYESWLKKKDTELGTVVGAAGELFAIRTDLFEVIPTDTIIEDFFQTLRIAQKGYRVAYAPDAYAIEQASADVSEEIKRKIRICAGAFQAMWRLRALFNPFKYGMLTFQYVSHRVLRWTLAPLTLPILLIVNGFLALNSGFYQLLLLGQVLFYLVAYIGYLTRNKPLKIKGFSVPFYFTMMNVCVYLGFVKYWRGNQSVVWDKAKRAENSKSLNQMGV